jgi:hypothetical protein
MHLAPASTRASRLSHAPAGDGARADSVIKAERSEYVLMAQPVDFVNASANEMRITMDLSNYSLVLRETPHAIVITNASCT